MNTSFIIVCLIVVGSVLIPFFLFASSGQRVRKEMETKIKQVVNKNKLNISESEIWGNTYIGIDTAQRKLIFLKLTASEILEQLVDLNTLKECHIMEKRNSAKNKKSQLLEKLDLEILLKNSEPIRLNFYDIDQMHQEDFELQRIQKWKAILFSSISSGKQAA